MKRPITEIIDLNDSHKQSLMISLFLFFLFTACSSDTRNLQLEFLNQELRIGRTKPKLGEPCINTCADVSFRLSNPTEKSYILYDFNRLPYLSSERDSLYHNDYIFISGVHVFVYDSSNKQIWASVYISSEIDYKAMTPEFREMKLKEHREQYRESKQVIHKGQSFEFNHKIDFKDFELESGTYYVKLLYFQGPNVINKVDNNLIEEDKKSNDAEVYIGRFWSNKVKLIVE